MSLWSKVSRRRWTSEVGGYWLSRTTGPNPGPGDIHPIRWYFVRGGFDRVTSSYESSLHGTMGLKCLCGRLWCRHPHYFLNHVSEVRVIHWEFSSWFLSGISRNPVIKVQKGDHRQGFWVETVTSSCRRKTSVGHFLVRTDVEVFSKEDLYLLKFYRNS